MIESEIHRDVTVLRLVHGKANALDLELLEAVEERFRELEGGTGAVVLAGRGSIFSAGVDLVRILDGGDEYLSAFLARLHTTLLRLFAFPRPLVAAVNGHAIAGGCVVAAAADRRIMAAGKGRIGVPELRVGVPFPVAPLEVMRAAVPVHYLSEILLGGATYTPEDALQRGLVDEVVDADQVEERALEVASDLAAIHPPAFELTKRQLRAPGLERMRAAGSGEEGVRAAWASQETLSVIRAYVTSVLGR